MSITVYLAELVISIISKLGLPGVFFLMTLESALIPIPSEVVMVFAGFLVWRREMGFLEAVLAGTLGNYVGSVIVYFLGRGYGFSFLYRYGRYFFISREHLEKTEIFFQEKGKLAVFVGRMLPAVRTFISLPAGIARMSFGEFSIYTVLGSIPWNMALTYLGIVLGENWCLVVKYSSLVDLVAVVLLIAILVYFYFSTKGK